MKTPMLHRGRRSTQAVRSAAMTQRTLPSILSIGSVVTLCAAVPAPAQQPSASQTAGEPVIYLNQAWSQDDREWYYNFSQGSAVLSYDIFLNLEIAGGQDLFRSDGNLARYGLSPTPANKYTPD